MSVPVYFSSSMPRMRSYTYAAGCFARRPKRSLFKPSYYILLFTILRMDSFKINGKLCKMYRICLEKMGAKRHGSFFGGITFVWCYPQHPVAFAYYTAPMETSAISQESFSPQASKYLCKRPASSNNGARSNSILCLLSCKRLLMVPNPSPAL